MIPWLWKCNKSAGTFNKCIWSCLFCNFLRKGKNFLFLPSNRYQIAFCCFWDWGLKKITMSHLRGSDLISREARSRAAQSVSKWKWCVNDLSDLMQNLRNSRHYWKVQPCFRVVKEEFFYYSWVLSTHQNGDAIYKYSSVKVH